MWIRDRKTFADAIERLRKAGSFGFDTEFIREKTYRPRLCLLQIGTRDFVAAVDPFEVLNLSPFVELLADPTIETVAHAAAQDLEIFFADRAQTPRNVFDTQIAAALVGYGDRIGYASLVKSVLGVDLTKREAYTDWAQRPLTDEQVEYALDDVRYLLPLRKRLGARLREMNREAWLAEEMKVYENRAFFETRPELAYLRLRGTQRLGRAELGVLRELARWREEEAKRLDRPRGWILPDHVLLELARRRPEDLQDLRRTRGLHPKLLHRCGDEILRRIRKAKKLPEDRLPEAIERGAVGEDEEVLVDLLQACVKIRARELKIGPSHLAGRNDLLELIRSEGGRDSALTVLKGWRRDAIGEDLMALLHGRARLAVNPRTGRAFVERRRAERNQEG